MIKNFIRNRVALILGLMIIPLAGFALSACSQKQSGESNESSKTASEAGKDETGKSSELETVDIVLDWYPNAVHAFLYEAESKGYFADEGLKVNIIFPSNATDPITMSAAGKADIGLYYQPDVIIAKANENIPVEVIGAVLQKPNNIITYLNETGIKTPADLKGKTIGYASDEASNAIMAQVLKSANLTMDDVEMVDVGFELMSAMTTKRVDATYGCVVNHEIPQLEENGFDVGYMEPSKYGVPEFYGLLMVTSKDGLEKNKDKYTRFIRACKKGFEDVKKNPDKTMSLIIENQNEENFPLSKSVEDKSMQVLLPMMETDEAAFLSQDSKSWKEAIDWMKESGIIKSTFNPDEVFENLE